MLHSVLELEAGEKKFPTLIALSKGQMKSECIYEIIDFPKHHLKILIDFCPERLLRRLYIFFIHQH